VSAVHSDEIKAINMSDGKKTTTIAGSVDGIHRMKPSDKISRSFDGIVNMSPESQGAAQAQSGSAQSAKPPAPAPTTAPKDAKPE